MTLINLQSSYKILILLLISYKFYFLFILLFKLIAINAEWLKFFFFSGSLKQSIHKSFLPLAPSPASPFPAHMYNKTARWALKVYEHKLVNLALEQALLFLTAFV